MLRKLSILSILVLLLAACGGGAEAPAEEAEPAAEEAPADQQPVTAMAQLQPTEGNEVSGTVSFEETDGGVHITGQVTGLEADSVHGFHVHQNGDCSAPDGTSAGGHFNPFDTAHGGPDSAEHHVGDLGNITANAEGVADLDMTFDFLSLEDGAENSILGRGLIVHAGEDDFTSQPTGDAGARLACAVIEKQ
ncbi:MAG TPA: superoxide dismutase family protein [Acidobacteriota bacterium]|nr:superoxide dismutase family protein [Acidobacteriota bacterium]